MKDKKSIIIYFSRADENYFGGEMKYIDKENQRKSNKNSYVKCTPGLNL